MNSLLGWFSAALRLLEVYEGLFWRGYELQSIFLVSPKDMHGSYMGTLVAPIL